MNAKLILTMIIAMVAMAGLTGLTAAEPVDMSIYDRNTDGMIDTEERITLDIDIENSRLTPAESYVIDSYTTDGTIILTDEFRAAFLNPEAYPRSGTTEDEPVLFPDSGPVVATPVATPATTPEDTNQTTVVSGAPQKGESGVTTGFYVVVGLIVIVGLIAVLYMAQRKKE